MKSILRKTLTSLMNVCLKYSASFYIKKIIVLHTANYVYLLQPQKPYKLKKKYKYLGKY